LNGVTKAVRDPRKFVLAAITLSKRGGFCRPIKRAIHTGSEAAAKGPRRAGSRDFAVVLVQTSGVGGRFSILSTTSMK
jgi:hypothetical protein